MLCLPENSEFSFTALPVWRFDSSSTIVRPSRFFSMSPIGIGTRDVESLSGYVGRLAEAHCVSPVRILIHAANEETKLPFTLRSGSLSKPAARTLNGLGDTAKICAELISIGTRTHGIKYTTLLPWKEILSHMFLLKKGRSWCAECYNDQLNEHGFNYEKLLWCIEGVMVCPEHERLLETLCPHCGKKQKHLSNKMRPGFCSSCLRWLGHMVNEPLKSPDEAFRRDLWIAKATGDFLSVSTSVDANLHTPEHFVANLRKCIEQIAYGSINTFAHMTGMWHVTIRRVLKKETKPTMPLIQRICTALDIPIGNLFLDLYDRLPVGANGAPEVIDEIERFAEANKPPASFENEKAIAVYLESMLTEMPPVSGRQAAERLGWHDSRLYRTFPELYRKIVIRYKEFNQPKTLSEEEVVVALRKALKESPPPSLQSVMRRLGCKDTGYKYQSKFNWLCRQISRNFTSYRNKLMKDETTLNYFLKGVLIENPPPSVLEVASRLEVSRTNFIKKLPEQAKAIGERYLDYIVQERAENLENLENEVRLAVNDLIAKNIYPSEDRIKARLPRGYNDWNFKRILMKVKASTPFTYKPKY